MVKDTFPLHGSLEINNRYSASTTQLRLNGSISYDNLWQLGHSVGFSFQTSPEDPSQVQVFSAYYLARIPDMSWLSLMLQGTNQNSDVNTLAASAWWARQYLGHARHHHSAEPDGFLSVNQPRLRL